VNKTASRPDLVAVLQAYGITPTRQRIDVASVLLECLQHLSAEQVLARVNATGGQVSKATVYNTLGLFAARGLVREVLVDPTRVFYDSNVGPHHHLYDVDTGRLADLDPSSVSVSVRSLPDLPEGSRVEGIDVVIRVRAKGTAPDSRKGD
jgi:Fur family iron response transcriptional regulator